MKSNDEIKTITAHVKQEDLDAIAKELGVKIRSFNDIIEIEGDEAETDEAIARIMPLHEVEKEEIDERYVDPYEEFEAGQHREELHDYKPEEYSVYDLMKFNEDNGQWFCKVKTYHFTHHPYRSIGSTVEYEYVKPEILKNTKIISKRK